MPIGQQTLRNCISCAVIAALAFVVLVLIAIFATHPDAGVTPSWVVEWIVALFIGSLAALIVGMVASGYFDLAKLISETDGTASMARFQLLIFTFVIAGGLLVVILAQPTPTLNLPISDNVLGLLGISAGGYLGGKITQRTTEAGIVQAKTDAAVKAAAAGITDTSLG